MDAQAENLFDETPRRTFPIKFLLFGSASAAAIYFSTQGDYGTASAIALLGLALRSGYRAGAALFLGLFAGGALAALTAVPLGKAVEPLFEDGFGTQGLTNRVLSIGTVGTIVILFVTLTVRYAVLRLVRQQPRFEVCNRWIGLACGGIQGSLLLLFVAGGLIIVEPLARDELMIRPPDDRSLGRLVSEQVVMAAESTRTGKLGPLLAAYNPFDHIGPLQSLQHGVEVLRSPESLSAVTRHPAVDEFYNRPEFQQTLRQLSEDPQLRDILSSGEPITRETLSALMKSPAVLRLFDDRKFLQGLTRVLEEIDPQTLLSSTSQP